MTKVIAKSSKLDTNCYSECTSIKTIDLHNVPWKSNSMEYAFGGCRNLQSVVNINDNVVGMGQAFDNCINLTSVSSIPSKVTDMWGTFGTCKKLVNIPPLPNSVIDMSMTFTGCTNLVNAPNIPASVTNLFATFEGCSNLVNIPEIPLSVTDVSDLFTDCSKITKAPDIPNSVSSIKYAFARCTNLTGDINIYSNQITNASNCFASTTKTKNVYIPLTYSNGVNTQTYNAFKTAGYSITTRQHGALLFDNQPTPPPTTSYKLVAVGSAPDSYAIVSEDPMNTFTRVQLPEEQCNAGVIYKENDGYYIIPAEDNGKVFHSTDARTWTIYSTLDASIPSYDYDDIIAIYNPSSNVFMIASYNSDTYLISTDATHWTSKQFRYGSSSFLMTNISVTNGYFIVAGVSGLSFETKFLYSTNGTTWTQMTAPTNTYRSGTFLYDGSRYGFAHINGEYDHSFTVHTTSSLSSSPSWSTGFSDVVASSSLTNVPGFCKGNNKIVMISSAEDDYNLYLYSASSINSSTFTKSNIAKVDAEYTQFFAGPFDIVPIYCCDCFIVPITDDGIPGWQAFNKNLTAAGTLQTFFNFTSVVHLINERMN